MNFASLTRRIRSLNWPFRRSRAPRRLGPQGERAAAAYLKSRRIRVLARNYRCPLGEVDLICRDGDTIVFVEVKTRTTDRVQELGDTVRVAQWNRIAGAAKFFLRQCGADDPPWRLDLVAVEWPPHGAPRIEHFENAYQPVGATRLK